MWEYPKSALHQAAIDAAKPERDREEAKSRVAAAKILREKDAQAALQEIETGRLSILAKTQRLRAARLALEPQTERFVRKSAKDASL
jgi:SepF-like predicted cell division protein (DUF552 family)